MPSGHGSAALKDVYPPECVEGRSATSGVGGLGVLARQRPTVSHGGHHLDDGRAGRLGVAPIVHHRCVRRPLHDTVHAIGREGGQIVLQLEPTGLRFARGDHRQRFVPQAPRTPRSERLGGGKELQCAGTPLSRRGGERVYLRALLGRQLGDAGSSSDSKRTTPSRAGRDTPSRTSRGTTANLCFCGS